MTEPPIRRQVEDRLEEQLVKLRQTILFGVFALLGAAIFLGVAVYRVEWFTPTIVYFVVVHFAWSRFA